MNPVVDKQGKKSQISKRVPKSTSSSDFKKGKDRVFVNSRGSNLYNSRSKWYDPAKEELFQNMGNCNDYSRQRKLLDLASSSVFEEGVTAGPYHQETHQCHCEGFKPKTK